MKVIIHSTFGEVDITRQRLCLLDAYGIEQQDGKLVAENFRQVSDGTQFRAYIEEGCYDPNDFLLELLFPAPDLEDEKEGWVQGARTWSLEQLIRSIFADAGHGPALMFMFDEDDDMTRVGLASQEFVRFYESGDLVKLMESDDSTESRYFRMAFGQ